MKETNIYETPELEIIQLQQEEVIVTSGATEPYDLGDTSDWFSTTIVGD